MKTLKKIFSVFILILGVFGVSGLLMVFSIPNSAPDTKIAAPIMGFIGALLMFLGVKLWGWDRRRKIFGIVFTVMGLIFLPNGIFQFKISGFFTGIITVIFAAIFLSVGLLLIINQIKIDKEWNTEIGFQR